jgi:hypothetical protein
MDVECHARQPDSQAANTRRSMQPEEAHCGGTSLGSSPWKLGEPMGPALGMAFPESHHCITAAPAQPAAGNCSAVKSRQQGSRVSPGSKPRPHTRECPPARPSSSPAPLSSARVKLEEGWRWPATAAAGCGQCLTPRSAHQPERDSASAGWAPTVYEQLDTKFARR